MAETLGRWAEPLIMGGVDKLGNTLMVWFDDSRKEYISEETGEEVIIMNDKVGRVIRFDYP